ncbi:MAG: ABC transporter ATP-binding protein [Betaproteobacteria bacterium]|nr:ABC transporter ATP-binding protein [Betaproteobacteria bacterium]NBP39027.1 ABC transporter ATP-binding protein [Betaproteobacteria bacterium]NBS40078.1 ABC transporter ATP-binding protein [Betaproteobacteria bacterium]NBT82359.1 ABC transporter ATP-binding protein [Betaproteobacteria bacterium]NCV15168.1 ABC transporter ATP-binding protein [Betaproteobacteria bacterium]
MIELQQVCVRIGAQEVLRDINFKLVGGELLAVIGANGAGKTTLLRAISGLIALSAGKIQYEDRSISGLEAHILARRGLVHVPQGRQIVPALSVEDNLKIGAVQAGVSREEIDQRAAQEYRRFPVLKARKAISGASLSGGEQQMLALSRALMMSPRVLLLDEPSLGLAPQIVFMILNALRALASEGMAVLLVEQAAFLALETADRGIVLRNGEFVLHDEAKLLRKNKQLLESYLA